MLIWFDLSPWMVLIGPGWTDPSTDVCQLRTHVRACPTAYLHDQAAKRASTELPRVSWEHCLIDATGHHVLCVYTKSHTTRQALTPTPPPNHTTKTARGRPRRPRPDPVRPPPASHRPGGARFFVTHRPRLGLASRGGAADVVGVVGHRGGIPTRVYMGFYLYVPIPPRPPTRRICVCVCVF